MKKLKQQTIDTYNRSASRLAEYFRKIGSRKEDIERAVEFTGSSNISDLRILEIGCGDGRDALEIVKLSEHYVGIDISEGMITLARQALPNATFIVSDAVDYEYPREQNIIFAFASLLHCNKKEVQAILRKSSEALVPSGILYISLKEGEYHSRIKRDDFGSRNFYYYSSEDIIELAGSDFRKIYLNKQKLKDTLWLTIALQKN